MAETESLVLMGNDALFYLNGYVNQQSLSSECSVNPRFIYEEPLQDLCVTAYFDTLAGLLFWELHD